MIFRTITSFVLILVSFNLNAETKTWYIERAVISEWEKVFSNQLGESKIEEIKLRNPHLGDVSTFDTADETFSTNGELNWNTVSGEIWLNAVYCVKEDCILPAVLGVSVTGIDNLFIEGDRIIFGGDIKISILSQYPLIISFENFPGVDGLVVFYLN